MEFEYILSIINAKTEIELLTGFTATEAEAEETAYEMTLSYLGDGEDISEVTYDYWRA